MRHLHAPDPTRPGHAYSERHTHRHSRPLYSPYAPQTTAASLGDTPRPLCLPLVAPPPQQPHRTYQRNSICPRGGNLPSTKFNLPAAPHSHDTICRRAVLFLTQQTSPLNHSNTVNCAKRCITKYAPGNPAAAVPHRKARPRQSHYRLCHTASYAPGNPAAVCTLSQITPTTCHSRQFFCAFLRRRAAVFHSHAAFSRTFPHFPAKFHNKLPFFHIPTHHIHANLISVPHSPHKKRTAPPVKQRCPKNITKSGANLRAYQKVGVQTRLIALPRRASVCQVRDGNPPRRYPPPETIAPQKITRPGYHPPAASADRNHCLTPKRTPGYHPPAECRRQSALIAARSQSPRSKTARLI